MISHPLSRLTPRFQTKFNLGLFILVAFAFTLLPTFISAHKSANSQGANQLPVCTNSFAGDWVPVQTANGKLTISLTGDAVAGDYQLGSNHRTLLKGKIVGTTMQGSWIDASGLGNGGTFEGTMFGDNKLDISFYVGGDFFDRSVWTCQIAQAPAPALPDSQLRNDNYDWDQFRTFDALPKVQQEELLIAKGPRLPKRYNANDLEMRAFVQGGTPLAIDYELNSDTPALLNISVEDSNPISVSLAPAKFSQQIIELPDDFGNETKVGKLHISALTEHGEPAEFHLYGLAMGRIGAQALNDLISAPIYIELAMANQSWMPIRDYEPLALFAASPQAGSVIEIAVSPPTTITTGQRPKQEISFNFTSRSLFDNGRWDLLAVEGLTETHVWQKRTGRIRPNQTLSEKWDGKVTFRGRPSPGDHSLKVTAWRGDASRAFVIARATAILFVVK